MQASIKTIKLHVGFNAKEDEVTYKYAMCSDCSGCKVSSSNIHGDVYSYNYNMAAGFVGVKRVGHIPTWGENLHITCDTGPVLYNHDINGGYWHIRQTIGAAGSNVGKNERLIVDETAGTFLTKTIRILPNSKKICAEKCKTFKYMGIVDSNKAEAECWCGDTITRSSCVHTGSRAPTRAYRVGANQCMLDEKENGREICHGWPEVRIGGNGVVT